jgi:23S rRNA pseudouridine1911/1915/1917 synthase
MVIAKNDTVHAALVEDFKRGRVKKVYVCLVHGQMQGQEGSIDLPIARHKTRRKAMSVCLGRGKHALTFWKKTKEFHCGFSLLSVTLGTGRTHQIRVHLSHMGHPVVGDSVYGQGQKRLRRHPHYLRGGFRTIKRQMLHASVLGFHHPVKEEFMAVEAPLPKDFRLVLEELSSLEESLS